MTIIVVSDTDWGHDSVHEKIIDNLRGRGANWVSVTVAIAGTNSPDAMTALEELIAGGVVQMEKFKATPGSILPGAKIPMYRYVGEQRAVARRTQLKVIG